MWPDFALYCDDLGIAARGVARAIGCSTEDAARLQLSFGDPRRAIPKPDLAIRIQLFTGGVCPPGSFYPTPEQARLLAQRAAA